MKKLYTLCYILLVTGLLGTAVLIYLSPEVVPVHYNFAGEVDRFGSKYENLLWPFFSVIMGGFLMFIAKHTGKKAGEKDERLILYVTIATLVFFYCLGFFFMIKSMNYNPDGAEKFAVDVIKFISLGMGAIMIVLGTLMPGSKRNRFFGFRNKWTLANDDVWVKSHRFGGRLAVICGLVTILMAIFMPMMWNLMALFIVITVWVVLSTYASYYYYKKSIDISDK